jgi:hypothetical protein
MYLRYNEKIFLSFFPLAFTNLDDILLHIERYSYDSNSKLVRHENMRHFNFDSI